jgi:hypothetical protein
MRQWSLQIGALAAGLALLLAGLVVVGNAMRRQLEGQDRYSIAFADIASPSPPGQDRADFLSEVQYLGSMPSRLRLLDEGLTADLAKAFAGHPWVEKVERVEIASQRQVQVQLVFRTPVLAVPWGGRLRVVDRHGVLLPKGAVSEGLPVFSGEARPPAGKAGTPWGDPAVEKAARAAGKARSS